MEWQGLGRASQGAPTVRVLGAAPSCPRQVKHSHEVSGLMAAPMTGFFSKHLQACDICSV